jgi:hypothetical protein
MRLSEMQNADPLLSVIGLFCHGMEKLGREAAVYTLSTASRLIFVRCCGTDGYRGNGTLVDNERVRQNRDDVDIRQKPLYRAFIGSAGSR